MSNIFVGIRLPPEVIDALDTKAQELGKERSQVIREAIANYLGMSLDPIEARIERVESEVEDIKEALQKIQILLNERSQ